MITNDHSLSNEYNFAFDTDYLFINVLNAHYLLGIKPKPI